MAKKYSINWEDETPVSFEVDGVAYNSLEDVPNPKDRRKLEAMLDTSEEVEQSFEDFDKKFDKEFAEMKTDSKKMESIILWIFSGVAVLMLLIAGISSFFNLQKLSKEQSADGVVVDVVKHRQYIDEQDDVYDDYYFPVVRFTASDGKTRELEMSEGSSSQEYEAGNKVTVLYNPDHPLDARVKSVGSSMLMWILPGITGILGVAFGGAVWMVSKYLFAENETEIQEGV
jgi:flagellar basal body-associated protein FliL